MIELENLVVKDGKPYLVFKVGDTVYEWDAQELKKLEVNGLIVTIRYEWITLPGEVRQ